MTDAVICEPIRTPVGRYGGIFKDVPVTSLASTVMKGLVDRTGLTAEDIDDVIFGQGYPNGEAAAIGRIAALDAGLDVSVPGLQIDRRCGSGLQAVLYACMQVATGGSDLVLAGGAESMSQAEYYMPNARWNSGGLPDLCDRLASPRSNSGGRRYPVRGGMIETAENVAARYSVTREQQDEWALRSQQRAAAAIDAGLFEDEMIPVVVPGRKGEPLIVSQDEHPRPDTTIESLSRLKPIMGATLPGASVTAGNSSGQNDAAAIAIVTTPGKAEQLGLRPLARLVSWSLAGVEPKLMGIGPVPAARRALERASLSWKDIDLIELNEAFAAQVIGCFRGWELSNADLDRVNVNGSGISLGHPIGATGGRILANLLREMDRRESRYGMETMCMGGGQGLAAIFERVA
ncbi:acetyl-CoA acetyltransferase [Rhodococcus sp. 15-725-2-2b]|jgi:acetyl-CoA C-acetyltransferase|uniref:acetyl-CoA C-acetyltransferase n=1 Tax=Nocardiaceae TaxID=85025 RepID=UPI00055B42C5|nr:MULTISPECIES: acetyl-CoA C-acetyltransferase [Rhodococcus]OZC62057.1 acetyl-CoA acetyltransferase [Rhodococcus sp. 06-470-2]OZC65026.1 acetyl-CoA acetyltransferase [Rhodococcus sp. 06-469-3-2]OZC88424.1 acetyl-CoA acetyltransferase [Rhodococcus sp. 06-418-1B]OZD51245.1 acetyl-CoA acetyltransferase [Rhodococcus sp. 06-1477-1A]OZE32254.1 acetyl-CoA acetyltransferase [Rhodococcus sp. 05-2254-5]